MQWCRCRKHGKVMYASEASALAELERQANETKVNALKNYKPQRAYFDHGCGFWHLTHKPLRRRDVLPGAS